MIDAATYAIERAICDKAQAALEAGWPGHARGGAVPQAVCGHPDYKACDNAMRGRVEQYELRTNPPETFVAYVGKAKRNGMGVDRIAGQSYSLTTWMGDELGNATLGSSWRVNSFIGSRMYQIYAWMSGREYTGRGFGEGCAVVLRETAASRHKRAA